MRQALSRLCIVVCHSNLSLIVVCWCLRLTAWPLGHMNPQLPGVLRVNVPESRAALLPLLSDVLICRCVECIFGPCVDRVSLLSPFVMQAAHQGVAADNSAAHVLVKFGVHFHGALRWPNSSLQRDRAKSRPAPELVR